MLEFQEGFFEQEVREGFYLDATMKTLWAAELEVLQKVAEICDRYGLKWYAAYGTLLGAIRHEGFVPWDDDMDIWVKRPDYNILMQVLPKELPEGYLVRGPLTDEGYDQYHTCLNSGNGISIAKEWLEQYHGCPFTVGLDIFPLDYLPRNEKDRDLQVQLLTMTGRIAQLAKNVGRGDFDPKDSDIEQKDGKTNKKTETVKKEKVKTQKELVIEEIKLGIDYLEENCKLQVDHQLLEDENWGRLSSELWKWANYLAMMYSEDESDYLVEFFDYIQCPHKVYPKEWFADGYSATFENFMIPIPAGYEKILSHIYGNYSVCIKKTGTHEYPYYARQLKQLREYVKNIQQRAQEVGLVSIDEIEVKEETKELLPEWISLTCKKDGSPKKIVLSANNPEVFVKYGESALEKLEKVFQAFERVKESVLLWWRPQPVMKAILDRLSPELGKRYQEILECYRESGWGICDETDNIDRAVETCDIYYGDMNAVLQPFQDKGKAIVINVMEQRKWQEDNAYEKDYRQNNADRITEYRTFLSFTDYVEDAGRIYFANTNYNALVVVDKATWTVVEYVPFIEASADARNMHLQCVSLQNRIFFLPAEEACLHIYDMESKTQKACHFQKKTEASNETWGYFSCDDHFYLLPGYAKQGLWNMQAQAEEPVRESWWQLPEGEGSLIHGVLDENCFYTLVRNSNHLYITNVADKMIESFSLYGEQVSLITYGGQNFWYVSGGTSEIVCWNCMRGVVDTYKIPCDNRFWNGVVDYTGICFAGDNLFLISGSWMYVLDRSTREIRQLFGKGSKFFGFEMSIYFKCTEKNLVCFMQNAGEALVVDLETLEVKLSKEVFGMDTSISKTIQEYTYQILLDRKALLFEEESILDVDFVIQYCNDK